MVGTPKGILLDLDDTILDDSGGIVASWKSVCTEAATLHPSVAPAVLYDALSRDRVIFWADPDRHRTGRQAPRDANRAIIRTALYALSIDQPGLAERLADCYLKHRQTHQTLITGALDAIARLRARGARLALVTNGGAEGQRGKIERFGLARYFDGLFIERRARLRKT